MPPTAPLIANGNAVASSDAGVHENELYRYGEPEASQFLRADSLVLEAGAGQTADLQADTLPIADFASTVTVPSFTMLLLSRESPCGPAAPLRRSIP